MERMTLRDGAELVYEVVGQGPPLALVTGLGGIAAWWKPLVPALSESFTLILHDHRGTGSSTRSRIEYSVDQMADDLVQLLDHLGIERCHLCGHSTGGSVGQILAIERPKRLDRLVLAACWDKCDGYFKRLFDLRATMLESAGVDAYVELGSLVAWPADFIAAKYETLLAAEAKADRPPTEILLSRIRALQAFDRSSLLHLIKTPTLV
ncbi:MAG: alpha/beta hydrolase, partial [Acidobacteriota bacterium]